MYLGLRLLPPAPGSCFPLIVESASRWESGPCQVGTLKVACCQPVGQKPLLLHAHLSWPPPLPLLLLPLLQSPPLLLVPLLPQPLPPLRPQPMLL